MEYFLYITKSCNLNCFYCSGRNLSKGNNKILPNPNFGYIAQKIKKDIEIHNCLDNRIIFYGGESLLNQSDIKKYLQFFTQNNGNNIKFGLYTNGTTLDKIDSFILKHLKVLFISIDGKKEIHDKYRGKGTFNLALNNFKKVESKFKGESVGNITLTSENSIYMAVFNLIDIFDHIHWNLVNGLDDNFSDDFLKNYLYDIKKLVNYWIAEMKKGVVKNIIPFQVILSSLLWDKKNYRSYRCGCGTTLRVVDDNGDFYVCDELMDKQEFKVPENGNLEKWSSCNFYKKCKGCEINYICGGGCLSIMLNLPPEQIQKHCYLTIATVKEIEKNIAIVKKCLNDNKISKGQISTPISIEGWTECIP